MVIIHSSVLIVEGPEKEVFEGGIVCLNISVIYFQAMLGQGISSFTLGPPYKR